MLHNHPITSYFYATGYKGRQDIYEYWNIHKEEIKTAFYQNNLKEKTELAMEEFEQIIRWHSVYGLFFRFEVAKEHSKVFGIPKPIDQVSITTGDVTTSIMAYAKQTQLYTYSDSRSDLRGFSIVGKTVRNVIIQDINFDFGYFDFTTFDHVTFQNCSFRYCSFQQSRLIDCVFDKNCNLDQNDWSNTVISSTFNCAVTAPTMQPMKLWFLTKGIAWYQYKYPSFTLLLNDSFSQQTDDDTVKLEYTKQTTLREHIIAQLKRP